jgi:hypothetical protein
LKETYLKLVVLITFLLAFYATVVWHDAAERAFSGSQRRAVGVVAIIGWVLTFALASVT